MREITVKLRYDAITPTASAMDLADLFRALADDAAHFLSQIADDLESNAPTVAPDEIRFALDHAIPFISTEPTNPAR
jgi:hypothetical protein